MNKKLAMGVLLGALMISCMPSFATAAPGPYFWGGGYGAWGYPAWSYNYSQQRPPYFALYPPVYYSHPVKRPYGLSPFAWLPGQHGEAVRGVVEGARRWPAAPPEPKPAKLIQNRFVTAVTAAGTIQTQASSKPQRIVNPYVVRTGDPAATAGTAVPDIRR